MAVRPHKGITKGRGGIYTLSVTINGQRKQGSLGTRSLIEANEKAPLRIAEWEAEAKAVRLSESKGITFKEAMDSAIDNEWRELRECTRTEYIRIGHRMNELLLAVGLEHLVDITQDEIKPLRKRIRAYFPNVNSDTRVNRYMAVLRILINIEVENGNLKFCPKFKNPTEARRHYTYTPQQEQAMFDHFRAVGDQAMLDLTTILIDTGMRLSEALNIRPHWVDTLTWRIDIKNDRHFATKSKRNRTVWPTKRVQEILMRRLPQATGDHSIFSYEGFTRFSADKRWKRMREALGELDEKGFVMHSLRHTNATRLIQADTDMFTVQSLLGHTDPSTTQIYLSTSDTNGRRATQALEQHAKMYGIK